MATTITPSIGQGALFTQAGAGASPGYGAIDLRRAGVGAVGQEGCMDTHSYEVTQRSAGVNLSVDIAATTADALGTGVAAYIQGDTVSAQGLYSVPPHNAVINETISAANASNPRIDRVILEIQDNTHDASGANLIRTRVVTGTATAGATLDNLSNAAAVPSSALLLADVLVPANATSINNSNIRDRRGKSLHPKDDYGDDHGADRLDQPLSTSRTFRCTASRDPGRRHLSPGVGYRPVH
jgi:hypothetical protein